MKFHIIFLSIILATCLLSCSKNKIESKPAASLTVVNMVVGGVAIKIRANSATVALNAAIKIATQVGDPDIYVFPETDSLKPYYVSEKEMSVSNGDIYTLFLGGKSTQVDPVLIKENLPYRTDSTAGIRFIHLALGSPAINITLSNSTTVNEFSNILYKQITEFKSYPARLSNNSYTFQVRNAATNAVISSITISGNTLATGIPRMKNITFVFRGAAGNIPGLGVTRVNHY